jgi:hypothetical protein
LDLKIKNTILGYWFPLPNAETQIIRSPQTECF